MRQAHLDFGQFFVDAREIRDVPILTLILVRNDRPMPIGRRPAWRGLQGMMTRPSATKGRRSSARRASAAAAR